VILRILMRREQQRYGTQRVSPACAGMNIKGQCLNALPRVQLHCDSAFGREGRGGGRMAGPNAQKLVATDG
jgi:hypothetical protein